MSARVARVWTSSLFGRSACVTANCSLLLCCVVDGSYQRTSLTASETLGSQSPGSLCASLCGSLERSRSQVFSCRLTRAVSAEERRKLSLCFRQFLVSSY